jgi:two-component system response regulator NreC
MILGLVTSEAVPDAAGLESTAALTLREIDVLKLIVQGYTNRQIGDKLNISVRTVEGHRANLSEKLGMHSRVELVRYARDQGLLE